MVVIGMFCMSLQLSTCDILAEAKYAEKIREKPAYGPHILSYVWFGMNAGDLIGTALSGFLIWKFSAKMPYAVGLFPAAIVIIPIAMNYLQEKPVTHEEVQAQRERFYKQKEACFLCIIMFAAIVSITFVGLSYTDPVINCTVAGIYFVVILAAFSIVLSPTIAAFNAWSFIQSSCSVSTGGAAFYFMTDTPKEYPEGPHFSVIFYTTTLGTLMSVISLIGIVTYQKYTSRWRYRNL